MQVKVLKNRESEEGRDRGGGKEREREGERKKGKEGGRLREREPDIESSSVPGEFNHEESAYLHNKTEPGKRTT